MSRTFLKHLACLWLALFLSFALSACFESKPEANVVSGPTVLFDGKEWMRCSLGQTWDGSTCNGEIEGFKFDEAQAAANNLNTKGGAYGKTDWRVPTVRELASLRVCSNGLLDSMTEDIRDGGSLLIAACNPGAKSPTLDVVRFPNTRSDDFYWSSSLNASDTSYPWSIEFHSGRVYSLNDRDSYGRVRLVRTSSH